MKKLIKTALGRFVISVATQFPRTRRTFRTAGLRCSQGLFGNRIVSIPFDPGGVIRLTNLDESYLAFQLFWRGFQYYEPITRLLLLELLRPGATFLDIGAHHGFFSLTASLLIDRLRVIAFEPNPSNFQILEANTLANQTTNLHCEPLAISDREGTAALYLTASDMSASLMKGFQAQDTEQIGSVEVRTTTLDSYIPLNQLGGPMVIKVDIEGHEGAFMRGAAETIRRFQPDIVLEVVEDQDPSWVAELKSLGYHFYPITDQGLTQTDAPRLVKRFPFLFLNHLISARPREELAKLFERLEPRIRTMNLLDSSKHFPKEEWPLLWSE
jgi:FkbM family methyltransferase